MFWMKIGFLYLLCLSSTFCPIIHGQDTVEKMEGGHSLIQGNNLLAIKLHKSLARQGKNVFFSPCSVSAALIMLLHGLREEAEYEMRKFLGYENITTDALACGFESLNDVQDGYSISCANSLVVQKDFDVEEQYKSDLSKLFKALYMEADFVNENAATLEKINNWVKEKTNSMIPQLLTELYPGTVLVLLNAIYFKGSWLTQFQEKSTFMQYFYNGGTEDDAKLVEMMHMSESFLWVERESFKALQLPYRGEEFAMLVFLPNSWQGLHEMEDMLTPDFVSEIKREMHGGKVEVALPKFRLEYSEDLAGTFRELGVKRIFQQGEDFGGISKRKDLAVTKIVHKAVLEVNEEGCEAAAATAVIMSRCLRMTPEFIVDHPFAFVIYNVKSDLILFMGRVTEL